MTTFSPAELEQLKQGGNEVCECFKYKLKNFVRDDCVDCGDSHVEEMLCDAHRIVYISIACYCMYVHVYKFYTSSFLCGSCRRC